MPTTRFLIACEARTGSNWMCGLLNSHPQVLCHHEVFHPEALYYAFGYRDGRLAHLGAIQDRDRDPLRFARALWDEDHGHAAVGFKILAGQVPALLQTLLADTSVRKLILRRRSRVRAYLSLLRARQTGHWAQKSYDGVAVHVEPLQLAEFARRYERYYTELRAATLLQPAREVVYEDLERDPRVLAGVLRFLGVDAQDVELSARNVRQSQDTLVAAIANHAELVDALRGTPLEAELQDDVLAESAGA